MDTDVAAIPIEQFAALRELPVRHGFVGRVAGLNVQTDRVEALARLGGFHRRARHELGLGDREFITAEQIHGNAVWAVSGDRPLTDGMIPTVDGLVTDRADVCLGIYVADCGPLYLVDPARGVVGLVHSGRKGTALGIATVAIRTMTERFGSRPEDIVAQLGPCIRPPSYEVDFAAQITEQCRAAGVGRVEDCGTCTAATPELYYSYRREQGHTGRMLALLGLA